MFLTVFLTGLVAACANGAPNSKIYGGKDADIHDYPFQLQLVVNLLNIFQATLIAPVCAVTAAHLVNGIMLKVTVNGGSSIKGLGISRNVISVHVNPNFTLARNRITGYANYDVAVLCLDEAYPENCGVTPINIMSSAPDPGTDAIALGWGDTKYLNSFFQRILQEVTIPIVLTTDCDAKYEGIITDDKICAGAPNKGPCYGDSGGSLVTNTSSGLELVGLASFAESCGSATYPSVFSNLINLSTWIAEKCGECT